MDTAEEKALVAELAKLDESAWERFCHEYAPALFRFVQLCFGCRREQAEDIVQMAFTRCVRSIGTFDPARGRLAGWLRTVARNEAHTCLRKGAGGAAVVSLSSLPRPVADQILEALDNRPLPDEVLAREDVRLAIRSALSKLNARHREVLICKYVEGMRMTEIAAQIGVSEKAVESVLSRARAAFREVLSEENRERESQAAETPR